MKLRKYLAGSAIALATMALSANTAYAACATDGMPSSKDKPSGYPARALTMIQPVVQARWRKPWPRRLAT
jgi:hypothetical protein